MFSTIDRFLFRCVSLVICGAPLLLVFQARADVRLPAIFSDHMVLQADVEAPIWGWAQPGEEVTVSINGTTAKTTAGSDGKWQLKVGKLAGGGPHTLEIAGKNNLA